MSSGIPLLDIFTGYQQAKSLANQAQAARIEASMAQLRGEQIGAASRDSLHATLSNISAIQAARGTNVDSPSSQAVEGAARHYSLDSELAQRLGTSMQAATAEANARGYQSAANWAIPLAGVESVANNAQIIMKMMG